MFQKTNNGLPKKNKQGKKYKKGVIELLKKFGRIKFKSDNGSKLPDYLYVNSLDIIFVKISKFEKTIYLVKPFAKDEHKCYEIKW